MEELGEMCSDEMVEKCVIENRRTCQNNTNNCVKAKQKKCRTVNTKQCKRRHVRGKRKTRCENKRICDYMWQAEGEAEVMVEVPGSCRNTGGSGECSGKVCENVPVNICEEVTDDDCAYEEFVEESCREQPMLVCKEEKEVGCQQVIKRVKKRVSRKAERKVCRE